MSKTVSRFVTAAMLMAMIAPVAAQACELNNGEGHAAGMLIPADRDGDANSIGKFSSNEANQRLFKVNGKVTAVSATSLTVQRTDEETGVVSSFTFVVDSNTVVIRKFKSVSMISEVSVGDKVRVWATSKVGGTAKLVWDKSIWRVALKGTISDLNSTDKTFKLTVTRIDKETGESMSFTVMVKTLDATTYWQNDTAKAFSDLANGQMVYVRGTWDRALQTLWAKTVSIIPSV